jgi:hypothetical protein
MKNRTSDQDVLKLLTGLKNAEGNYPTDMIQTRREMFVKQAAAMAVMAKAASNSAGTSGSGQGAASSAGGTAGTAGTSLSISTLLETALVIAIVVEAGVATYFYRDKIAEFISSNLSPKVEHVASPPGSSLSDTLTGEASSTETPEGTVVVTETDTLTPPVRILPAANGATNSGVGTQVVSTPTPDDHPGLHLGQTKQPTIAPEASKAPKDNNKKD